ncbi:DNA-binding transcriptional regulator, LysR family [Roseibium denhamense]|uniref:DNA-binding transcriptional regulator, LysR family n=2 Tax=Roseibium denhamense TaxID=76305 RepID=A0ABY1P1F3_9HYPH|nr:DNA-binding transcriptional regulator, LysR family [Roseibium denhamense]
MIDVIISLNEHSSYTIHKIMSSENLTEYLRIFRAVVDRESFSAAARELNMTPAWVARQVTRLEEHVNATLLIRTTRHLRLTDAGQDCYRTAGRVAEELQALRDHLQKDTTSITGTVRLNVPTVFALSRLGGQLAAFQKTYPNLTLDVTVSDRFVDLFNDGADIFLRIAHTLEDSNAVVQKVCDVPRVLCAAPGYLARGGTIARLSDIQDHKALVFSGLQSPNQWHLSDGKTTAWVDPNAVLRANNSLLLKKTALSGAGLAFLPRMIVEEELQSGGLVQLDRFVDCSPFQMYLLRPPLKHLPARTRIVWDFLSAGANAA